MVSVNNNPFGKTDFIMSVSLNPVHERGSVTITKKDDKTGAVLTGASFDLYEWSTSKGQFVKSTLYGRTPERGDFRGRTPLSLPLAAPIMKQGKTAEK